MPSDNTDLETAYSVSDYEDVSTNNGVRVAQTGFMQYMLHQFKDHVGEVSSCTVEWEGQSTLAPSASIVKLQIFNHTSGEWDDVDTDSASDADTDFTLTNSVDVSANYKDASNVITCRVYQEAL